MEFLSRPDARSARDFVASRILAPTPSGLVLLIGSCKVEYDGRASSRLEAGSRLLLIKQDGSLLLHGATGVKAINWQPPGCRFDVEAKEDGLVVWARRTKPPETVRVFFDALELVASGYLEDRAVLALSGSEFDLRDLLRERPALVEPGFKPWERERLTDQGPMDLYGEDSKGRRVVIEVKRTKAGLAEATQLWRYVEAERRRRSIPVRGILLAPAVSERARILLEEHGLEFLARAWNDERTKAVRALPAPRQPSLASFSSRVQTDNP